MQQIKPRNNFKTSLYYLPLLKNFLSALVRSGVKKWHLGFPWWYSTFSWKIPWTEEPGRLQSMGSLRVRHNGATSLSLFTFMHWRRKWQLTPVFLPGESQGRGSLVGCLYGVAQSRTRLKQLSSSSRSIPKYFILFVAMVNGIVSLISISIWMNSYLFKWPCTQCKI